MSHVLSYEMDQLIAKFRERTGKSCNAIEELFEVYKMIQELVGNFNHSKEYDIHKYYPELCSRFRELRQQKLFDAACANLIKGQEEGLYRKDLNPVIIAKLHLFRFETLSQNTSLTSQDLASSRVFHEIFVFHLYGIMSDRGRDFFNKNFSRFTSEI